MVWEHNRRNVYIPVKTVRFVRRRDNDECTLRISPQCTGRYEQIDHVVRVADTEVPDNSPSNLRCVCEPCHKMWTQQQNTAGYQPSIAYPEPPRHPGLRW